MYNSEKAIQNFYDWEIKGRGYLLFPDPVIIEPPFDRFSYPSLNETEYVDDGKVPRLFERLFSKKKRSTIEQPEQDYTPRREEYSSLLTQINISFYRVPDLKDSLIREFLNMLSESHNQISFELIGKYDSFDMQIVCSFNDERRIEHLLNVYFPEAIIRVNPIENLPFEDHSDVLIVDFGYNEEFMRPLDGSINGLIGIISVINNLRRGEVVMFQIIFKGVSYPWSESIMHSVSIGKECFFEDAPEMLTCARKKTSSPLYSVIVRLAVTASNRREAERLAYELIQDVNASTKSEFNSLIPLSNEGYSYETHLKNLKRRGSNRLGMIMNTEELSSFVYFPMTNSLISTDKVTKAVPESLVNNPYFIGVNSHLGIKRVVSLNDSQRLRHTHIIGATGTGKSTLITHLFLEDVRQGNGCVIFDPHGDTIDDIIPRIPSHRLNDVILIDPSDYEYAFCINLLSAKSDIEKIVLSSDLVEAFRRHSTSWGDQMTSVLSNAITTFLESSRGGTLLDLKRFLIESAFRKEFLKSVGDKSCHYYWDNEYPLLKKGSISPLLTRLDTFLRPKLIRNMLSEKEGLNFNEVLNGKKILLVKLSQGLIGEENCYLLGTLLLSKIYQVAQARQSLAINERFPFYVYLDEFQNFITPSISGILSGARKYNLGLILAHQELNQIKDQDIYNSLLSNANIRICFRLGDIDAKKLESNFSSFDSNDLQNLSIGEAIARVGRNTEDFSLETVPLADFMPNNNGYTVIANSRSNYSKKISEIEDISSAQIYTDELLEEKTVAEKVSPVIDRIVPNTLQGDIQDKSKEYLATYVEKEEIREHRYLQTFIKKIAEQRGFKASIEEIVDDGRVDVSLIKDNLKIACEIAVHNSASYEVKNIEKCLKADYSYVCVISKNEKHLDNIQSKWSEDQGQGKIRWFKIEEFIVFLDSLVTASSPKIERIRGYRVKVNYSPKKG